MTSEGGLEKMSTSSPAPPSPSPPVSPHSDQFDESEPQVQAKEEMQQSLEAANFHRGLISLKQMQERSFSLVNQALLRQKFVEEQIKIERDTENVTDNNNDNKSVNNNNDTHNRGQTPTHGRGNFCFQLPLPCAAMP